MKQGDFADGLARRFCGALYADTEGRPMQYRMIATIAARARIREDDALQAALVAAVAVGGREVEASHSVQLTDQGRQPMAKP
jgi:hypothetical protein